MSLSCILVVEDSKPDQFLCECVIEEYDPNIKILMAADGQQALEILETADIFPDVIFLDVNMPRIDGFSFLDQYEEKYQDKDKTSTVIMLTSSNQDRDKDNVKTYSSVKAYFEKPLVSKHLEKAEKLLS